MAFYSFYKSMGHKENPYLHDQKPTAYLPIFPKWVTRICFNHSIPISVPKLIGGPFGLLFNLFLLLLLPVGWVHNSKISLAKTLALAFWNFLGKKIPFTLGFHRAFTRGPEKFRGKSGVVKPIDLRHPSGRPLLALGYFLSAGPWPRLQPQVILPPKFSTLFHFPAIPGLASFRPWH